MDTNTVSRARGKCRPRPSARRRPWTTHRTWIGPLALVLASAASPSWAAEVLPEGLSATQVTAGGRRLETGSFLFARYASVSSSAIFAGVGFGKAGMFLGIVQNPRSGYRELIAGAMTRVAWPRQSLTLGLAAADASDGNYAQVYVAPSFTRGALSLDGTLEWYEPLEHKATRQLGLNSLTLMGRVGPRLAAGAGYAASFLPTSDARQRLGPALRVEIPHGSLEVEYLAGLRNSADELRTTVRAGF